MENPEISPEEEITSENTRTENTGATSERTESVPDEALEQSESSKATLDDMTLEPQAAIEQSMDYAQAEEIERTLTTLVETAESTSADNRVEDATAASTENTIEAMPINTPGDGMPVTPDAVASAALIPENDLQDENEIIIESVITGRAEVPTTASSETTRITPVNTTTENTALAAEPPIETPEPEQEQSEMPSSSSGTSISAESTSPPETSTNDLEVKTEGLTSTEDKTEGTDEQKWNPPGMYVHVEADGTTTVVDANGKPVDSPPNVNYDESSDSYTAWYTGDPDGTKFEAKAYTPKIDSGTVYIHLMADGTTTVVDANGKPVDSPPNVHYDESSDSYMAYYTSDPDGTKFEAKAYTPKIDPESFFVHAAPDGSYSIVDANGKPVDSPPTLIAMDGNYYASYFGDTQSSKVELSIYKSTMKDFFIHAEPDGSYSVVDANGKPVDSPPLISGLDGNYYASYFGDTQGVKLETYKPEIKELFFHLEADGSASVVDAKGVPVDSPPNLSWGGDYSSGKMIAWYSTDPNGTKTTISLYKPSAGSKNNIPE